MSISSAQLKPTIAKRSTLRRSQLSKSVRIGVRFRFAALHAPASGDKRKSSSKSSFKTSRIPHSAFFMELHWRRKTNQLTYDTSALNTRIYASRKTTEAGVRRLPAANHHGIQEYSRRPAPKLNGDRRRSHLTHTVSSSLV